LIIVDTGAWVGLANRRDDYHEPCRRFFLANREPLITTFPVLVETVHLPLQRVGVDKTLAWMDTIQSQGNVVLEGDIVSPKDATGAWISIHGRVPSSPWEYRGRTA
jgi:predicted nucleic acid-binding protein